MGGNGWFNGWFVVSKLVADKIIPGKLSGGMKSG